MKNENVSISAPWYTYYREIYALLGTDPAIKIDFDDEKMVLTLYVTGDAKATALAHLLPAEKEFGLIKMKIIIIPGNEKKQKVDYLADAFSGNPILSYIFRVPIDVTQSNPMSYVAFRNEVVQYYNDNLGDPHGNVSTLSEILARDVFGEGDGVFYCTDRPGNPGNNHNFAVG